MGWVCLVLPFGLNRLRHFFSEKAMQIKVRIQIRKQKPAREKSEAIGLSVWRPVVYGGGNEMPSLEDQFDEAMFEFTTGHCDTAIERLRAILEQNPDYFDAQLALGGAAYARGDYGAAIAEGHKAEKLRPHDQLVHTNLSRAYMKAGDKKTAEHHALQARIASWRENMAPPSAAPAGAAELEVARPKPPPMKAPEKFPEMPWKKNKS
jgi:predicted Zn-dependent protease